MAADNLSRCLLLLSISGLATAGFFSVPRFGGSWLGRLSLPKFEFKPETFELKPLHLDDIRINPNEFKMPEIKIPETKFNPISQEEITNILNRFTKDGGTNRFNRIPPNDKELYSLFDQLGKAEGEDKLLKPKGDENVHSSKTNEDEMKKKETGKNDDDDDDHHPHIHPPHGHHDDDDNHQHPPHGPHSNDEHPHTTQGEDFRDRICDDNGSSASTTETTTLEPSSGNSSALKHFLNTTSRRAKIWTIVLISLGVTVIVAVGGYLYKSRKKTRHMDAEYALFH